jgi:hypothetical protein
VVADEPPLLGLPLPPAALLPQAASPVTASAAAAQIATRRIMIDSSFAGYVRDSLRMDSEYLRIE